MKSPPTESLGSVYFKQTVTGFFNIFFWIFFFFPWAFLIPLAPGWTAVLEELFGLTCSHERARLSPSTVFKLQYELKNSTLNTSDSKRIWGSERATSPKHEKETKSHLNAQQHVPSGRPRLILYVLPCLGTGWEHPKCITLTSWYSRRCRGHPCSPSMCFNVVISLKITGGK